MNIREKLKIYALFLLLVQSSQAYSCGFFTGLFTTEHVSLDYVGQINFAPPIIVAQETIIPISFKGGEWNRNSGIVLKMVKAEVNDRKITIKVVTCLAGGSNPPRYEINLKEMQPGKYQVFYQNPNGLKIEINEIEL